MFYNIFNIVIFIYVIYLDVDSQLFSKDLHHSQDFDRITAKVKETVPDAYFFFSKDLLPDGDDLRFYFISRRNILRRKSQGIRCRIRQFFPIDLAIPCQWKFLQQHDVRSEE